MSKIEKKDINYLRQSKGYGYRQPVSHNDYEFVTHRFTESKLIEYIVECVEIVKMQVDEEDIKEIENFVKNNKS
tara:strand:+ start:2854 stop:3075 length:222 start_codon:yes stop_codon:yes gene_type:complete